MEKLNRRDFINGEFFWVILSAGDFLGEFILQAIFWGGILSAGGFMLRGIFSGDEWCHNQIFL